jgi:hypothetical protein
VLPLLEETVNRDAVRHLAQLAQRARELYPVIHRRAVKLLRSAKIQDVGHVAVFDQRPLRRAAVAVLQEALRQLWRRQGWPLAAMCAERWYGVIRVCRGERTAVQLPGGVTVRQRLNVVQFSRNEPAA